MVPDYQFDVLEIEPEHIAVVENLSLAEFAHNDFSGQIKGVDWPATNIVLNRSGVEMDSETFSLYRIALKAYARKMNELSADKGR